MIRSAVVGVLIVITVAALYYFVSVEQQEMTPTAAPDTPTPEPAVTEIPSATVPPTATPDAPTPTAVPSPTATPVPTPVPSPTATPEPTPIPSPTPDPGPAGTPVTVTPCCGLFAWLGETELLVFDDVPGEREGSWRVNVETGARSYVAAGFGLPSESGVIAFPRGSQEETQIIDLAGGEVQIFSNQGQVAWPSPDGLRVAWFENLPMRTPSSSVNRSVRLRIGDVADGSADAVLELQAAEVHWLPDNRHLIIPGRDLNFEQAGIWKIDVETGEYDILFEERFIQAVRVSPDGERIAMMRTFNDDPAQNGVWTINAQGGELRKLPLEGSFRWGSDSSLLWFLEMTPTGDGNDRLLGVWADSGEVEHVVELDGQVLNDTWEVSPDGSSIAFWRHEDGQVVVQTIR